MKKQTKQKNTSKTVSKSNRQRTNYYPCKHIHDQSLSWLGAGT